MAEDFKNPELLVNFVSSDWGKNGINILILNKEGPMHDIKEIELSTSLSLDNHRDFTSGDNSDVISTDSQKNIVNILAKQHGIQNIEAFGILVCKHFLRTYPQLTFTRMKIEETPWRRMEINQAQHTHAFHLVPDCRKTCEVMIGRNGEIEVCSGIKGLRMLKTTKSGFSGFVNDEYTLLPESDDRLFSSIVTVRWWYNPDNKNNFDAIRNKVKDYLLEAFAGPADKGVYVSSTENTLYLTAKYILSKIPEIAKIDLTFPNKHYIGIDFSKFPSFDFRECKNLVYTGLDKPSGNIHAVIERNALSKL